jgi:hypothetical protein
MCAASQKIRVGPRHGHTKMTCLDEAAKYAPIVTAARGGVLRRGYVMLSGITPIKE